MKAFEHLPDVTKVTYDFWHMTVGMEIQYPMRTMKSGKTRPLLLQSAGIIAWLSTGIPAMLLLLHTPAPLGPVRLGLWFGAFLVFGRGFWHTSRVAGEARIDHAMTVWLGVQTATALGMFAMICTGFESVLLVVVAAQLGLLLPSRPGLAWIVIQTALIGGFSTPRWATYNAFRWMAATFGFELFAFFLAAMTRREATANAELARANAELRATQQLLTESSRMAERMRIARELHDVLGHDLTALSLHLEVAGHLTTEEKAHAAVSKAQQIAKQLLGDVREVVSTLRDEAAIDVARAIRTLLDGIARPHIHLTIPDHLTVTDPRRAQALLRCIQEATTNAMRHARAANLWIELVPVDGGIQVQAYDDGPGVEQICLGHGLRGMRERFEEMGGRLDLHSAPRQGFAVTGWLPERQRAT
jgi:signal transduction histidine kinase